jgi:hypothetical protein
MMCYANFGEGVQLLIFTAPIRLQGKDFLVQLALNKCLEFMKFLEDFRFILRG